MFHEPETGGGKTPPKTRGQVGTSRSLTVINGGVTRLRAIGSYLDSVHTARAEYANDRPDCDNDPFYEPHWHLRELISGIPARSLAELQVKARAAQYALEYDSDASNDGPGSFIDLARSLVEDTLKLSSEVCHAS